MRIRLGWQLGLTYLILIALSMGVFGYFTMSYFETSFLDEKKAAMLTHANIMANASAPYLHYEEQNPYLNYQTREHAERVGTRFLVLNKSARVMADSADELTGRVIKHEEVTTALTGGNAANPHLEEDYGWVLYVAVPVMSGKQVIGAVFMSADINQLVAKLDTIRARLAWFSVGGGIMVFFVSLFLGKFLTGPLKRLTSAARKIASGEYGVQVDGENRKDELGDLMTVFNQMSTRIREEDRIRRQFIADASHELKSPVAAVKALLESFPENRSLDEKELRELLDDLKFEADRLGGLVEDLLMLSRIEGNRQQLNLRETSVGELTEAVRRAVLPLARSRGVEVETVHQGDLYWQLDGDKMFRALLNLVDNGVKYSAGSGLVTLSFRRAGDKLRFDVSNTGEGIRVGEMHNIFKRFYRIDKARARRTGGWGLGLAITKEIVEIHGGSISVTSDPGGLTVFTVEIPASPVN